MRLERVPRARRRRLLPEILDEPVDGHDPAAVDEQVGEEGTLLRGPQRHGPSIAQDLEGSQQPELDVHPDSQLGRAQPPLPPVGVSDA